MASPSLSTNGQITRAWALVPTGVIIGLLGVRADPAHASSAGTITPASAISLTQVALAVVIAAGLVALISWLLRRERIARQADHGTSQPDAVSAPHALPPASSQSSQTTAHRPIHNGNGNGKGHRRRELPAVAREVVDRFPELVDYPLQQCRDFVAGLGDAVIDRALVMFSMLRDRGEVSSADLATQLGVPVKAVSGRLTGRIARRATELGSDLPYEVARRGGGAGTVWVDREGIAGRMVTALADERGRRDHVRANSDRSRPS